MKSSDAYRLGERPTRTSRLDGSRCSNASWCSETVDGRHVIEPTSVRPGDGHMGRAEDVAVTVSVECAACGVGGDTELTLSAVVWDDP